MSDFFDSSSFIAASISPRSPSSVSFDAESSAAFAFSRVYRSLWCSLIPRSDSCASSYCLTSGMFERSRLMSSIIFLSSFTESDVVCCWCSSALIRRSISSTEKNWSSLLRRLVRSCCCLRMSSAAEISSKMFRFSCWYRRLSCCAALNFAFAAPIFELSECDSRLSRRSLIFWSRACSAAIFSSCSPIFSFSASSSGFLAGFTSFSSLGFLVSGSGSCGVEAAVRSGRVGAERMLWPRRV